MAIILSFFNLLILIILDFLKLTLNLIKKIFISFLKTLKTTLKFLVSFLINALFYLTRLLTFPFRGCFPIKSLNQMSGLDFERFAANWLKKEGYRRIYFTPVSSDYGVDILCQKDNVKIGVQCKRYSKNVGIGAVQEITAGLSYYDCQKGIVLTNSEFTKAAKELALTNGIELIDGKDLNRSKAGNILLQSNFNLALSIVIMSFLSLFTLFLSGFVFFKFRLFLPLTLMFLGICLLCLINGLNERKRRILEKQLKKD